MHEQFKRLVTVFGVPNRPDPEAFIREFVNTVTDVWPDGVLERAVSRLLAEHTEPFWPMPAKLKEICREECPAPKLGNDVPDTRPPLTDEQVAEQERAFREFKRRMAAMKLDEDDNSFAKLPSVYRDDLETMIQESPNDWLYRRRN